MTKTKTRDELAADAEARAAELRAQADAEAADTERRRASWQADRDDDEPAWWADQRSTFLDRQGGKVDAAWQAFVDAIRAGNPAVAEWTEYLSALRWRQADRLTVDGYFLRRELAAYEAREATARDLHGRLKLSVVAGTSTETRVAHNAGMTLDQWQARRDADLDDAEAALGAKFPRTPRGTLDAMHALPDWIGKRPATMGHGTGQHDPHGVSTYSEAVDKVTADLAREHVDQAEADRRAQLSSWLDERHGAEPQ